MRKIAVVNPNVDFRESTALEWKSVLPTSNINTQVVAATSRSNSSITWNVMMNNAFQNILQRDSVFIKVPVQITFEGRVPHPGYKAGFSGFRNDPLASIIQILTINMNGVSVSYNLSDISTPMALCDSNLDNMMPQNFIPDLTSKYIDGSNTSLSPFSTRMDCAYGISRRAYPIQLNSTDLGGGNYRTVLTSDLIMSLNSFPPFSHGKNKQGISFSNFNVIIQFTSNLNRIWSCVDDAESQAITSMVVDIMPTPTLTYTQLSLPANVIYPKEITYPYYLVTHNVVANIDATPKGTRITNRQSSIIQLTTIPSKLLIYVRRAREEYNSIRASIVHPDSFCPINKIALQIGNSGTLLSSMTEIELFRMSKNNGLIDLISYCDFYGSGVSVVAGSLHQDLADPTLGGCVVIIDPIRDLSLDPSYCVGLSTKINLSFTIDFTANMDALVGAPGGVRYEVCCIQILEGIQTIIDATQSMTTTNVINSMSDLQLSSGSYDDIMGGVMAYGGSREGAKKFFSGLNNFLKSSGVISKALSAIPHPISRSIGNVASQMGYGEDEVGGETNFYTRPKGGVLVGGKYLSKAQMQQMLKRS